jgi:hypothetical protein
MTETKRKGSRSVKDIPANILQQLNAGEIESANLVENIDYKCIDPSQKKKICPTNISCN